eukprot:scaffold8191_cov132-Isochrysis_galbana.AAC.1
MKSDRRSQKKNENASASAGFGMADARSGSSRDALWRSHFGSTGSGKPAKPEAGPNGLMGGAGSTPPC